MSGTVQKTFAVWLENVSAAEQAHLLELAYGAQVTSTGAEQAANTTCVPVSFPLAIEDAFYRPLAFGTGGLRGKLGLGPNRMNIYTVGQATQGLANYLNAHFKTPSVAVCRDSRRGGEEFVRCVAEVLAANGIVTYTYPRVEPTPALSFAIRYLGCSAGINITASHNPAEYNGYKVYGPDGCQITVAAAAEIQAAINKVNTFEDVQCLPFEQAQEQGLACIIADEVLDAFCAAVLEQSTGQDCTNLSVVYTPLNGTGLECVSRILKAIGVAKVEVVSEQAQPDGAFPTCPYPNPEERKALELGLAFCNVIQPNLLLATDPDADRLGIAVLHEGCYVLLSGNEVGLLLTDFLARRAQAAGESLAEKVVCTTVVSAPMADDMARDLGFELRRSLTGFKYIGEQIGLLEEQGRLDSFLFGFEESYGYLAGTHARDKDAVVASMLVCELAAYWAAQGLDLYEAMDALYSRYDYWVSNLISVTYDGAAGASRMQAIMEGLHAHGLTELAGFTVEAFCDYSSGVAMPQVGGTDTQMLPAADLLEYWLAGGSRVLVRPSGTEPKIKAYVFAKADSRQEAGVLEQKLSVAVNALIRPGGQGAQE